MLKFLFIYGILTEEYLFKNNEGNIRIFPNSRCNDAFG